VSGEKLRQSPFLSAVRPYQNGCSRRVHRSAGPDQFVAIGSGFVVMYGLLAAKRLDLWTCSFC